MRKPKAGTLKRPPSKQELPNPNAKKWPTGPTPPRPTRPMSPTGPRPTSPTGPDNVGPYSRYGTAGPVNETVSRVRDILRYDDNGLPIPYRKKGGTMKKTIKKVVAKAPVKKTVAKKPMMKTGGAKKPLRKAQTGDMVAGPMTESKQKYMDKAKANAVAAQKANIVYGPKGEYDRAYGSDMADIKQKENQARMYQKKGGVVKKVTAKKVMVKSKKK